MKVNYHYQIKYVPRGCKDDRETWWKSSVDVEFDAVSSKEAPIVARIGNGSANANILKRISQQIKDDYFFVDRFSRKFDGEPRQLRYYDGKFFIEVGPLEDYERTLSNPYQLSKTLLGQMSGLKIDMPGASYLRSLGEVIGSVGALRQEKTHDQAEQVAEKIKQRANFVKIIDGIVFEQCNEPLILKEQGKYVIHEGPDYVGTGYQPAEMGVEYKHVDQSSERFAMDEIKSIEMRGADDHGLHVEIFDESVFSYDGFIDELEKCFTSRIVDSGSETRWQHSSQYKAIRQMREYVQKAVQGFMQPTNDLELILDALVALNQPEQSRQAIDYIFAMRGKSLERKKIKGVDNWGAGRNLSRQAEIQNKAITLLERYMFNSRLYRKNSNDMCVPIDDSLFAVEISSEKMVRRICRSLNLDVQAMTEVFRGEDKLVAFVKGKKNVYDRYRRIHTTLDCDVATLMGAAQLGRKNDLLAFWQTAKDIENDDTVVLQLITDFLSLKSNLNKQETAQTIDIDIGALL